MLQVANTSFKVMVEDIARTMPQVANISSMIMAKGTHKTHNQTAKLISQAFNLFLFFIVIILS